MKKKIGLLAIMIFLLSACSHDMPPAVPFNNSIATGVLLGGVAGAAIGATTSGMSIPITAAMGGIVGGAIGTAMEASQTPHDLLLIRLQKAHVLAFRVGEDYLLVLPSDLFFYPDSTHLNPMMYQTLQDIMLYINHFDIEAIKVAGFTDCAGSPERNLALSRQQAQIIADELWRMHVNSTLIYAVGYGDLYPIAYNDNLKGVETNRRIQITFRKLSNQS